ncbi:hypothetical protein PPTG_18876 [Phytophthora nicotianae INRA-310]|uniref:NADP-dependent oxidoreductase domain-containing protein n=2 Tax=Phytophthora nicotianae TaxID=4792 RepID=W2PFM4_PHYN3|nr:hypothetical protein PPTG_18876 [Phytophthora nicotianae INRA-310]ETM99445.1 hypothetical protein PPTG_18876 [Phytophthora nicotianae INRA-310]ETO59555.1 hypothetical protein F444_22123 [Phytophthora nicotianae P1976]
MSTSSTTAKMTYRFLGNSGLIVSKFGLGSWMPYYEKYTVDASVQDRRPLGVDSPHRGVAGVQHLERNKVDHEYTDLYKEYKLGLTTWSPLAFGTLTGKYSAGELSESFEERVVMADQLKPIATELGCTLAQMSLAWAVSNENVSAVMIGASHPSQLEENIKALELVDKITPFR